MLQNPAVKIAHIDTERTWRGGEQQVASLVEGLSRRGWLGLAIARPGSPFAERIGRFVPVVGARPWGEWDVLAARAVRRSLLAAGADVVHAHTGHAVALGALATSGTGIPMVATRRVDFPIGANPLSRWKYRRAARIVAISEGVRDVLVRDGLPPERIVLVRSGVDFRRYANLAPLSRDALRIPENATVVGQVAALAPHKDQATFLRAIASLLRRRKELVGVLVGGGDLRASLEATARKLRISDSVRFLGHRDDALSCLRTFDAFCFSSWAEGLGTSIIDAMALGVPVAATMVGGIPELVEDGVTGFGAPPRDPEALAAAVERCLTAPDRADIINRARRRAEEFSVDNTVTGMERVYRSLAVR